MESTAARGRAAFVFAVLETTASLLWREIAADPWHMAGLAFRGFLLELVGIFVASMSFGAVAFVGYLMGLRNPSGDPLRPFAAPLGFLGFIGVQVLVGRWLARRVPGRELSACLALTVLSTLLTLFMDIAMHDLRSAVLNIVLIPMALPLFVGAVQIRRKREARTI